MQFYYYLRNRLKKRIYQYQYKIMEDGKFYEDGAVHRIKGLPVANDSKQQAVSFFTLQEILLFDKKR